MAQINFTKMPQVTNCKCSRCSPTSQVTTPPPKVCSAKLDIGFVVDGSGSTGGKNFQRMLDFLKNLVSNFNISPQRTRAGLVLYSRNAALKFNFDDYSDVGSLQKAIGEIKYPHGRTYTGKALRLTKQLLFNGIPRQGAKRVVLVMTDGSADDDITGPSKDLKNSGVTIYGLGIGSSVNENQLKQMASVPPRDHVFKANFHSLNLVLKQIKKEMCQDVVSHDPVYIQELLEVENLLG